MFYYQIPGKGEYVKRWNYIFVNLVLFLVLLIHGVSDASEIIKHPVGSEGGADLDIGTVVKVTGDREIAPCFEGEEPMGIITGVEGFPAAPDSYVVSSAGIAPGVTVADGVSITAGIKLVPADDGKVQPLSDNPDGYIVGIALEDASGGDRIMVIIGPADNINGLLKAESANFKLYKGF